MRIRRHYPSRLNFRRRRRRSGYLPFVVLIGIVLGVVSTSWNWLERRIDSLLSLPTGAATDQQLIAAIQAFERGELDAAVNLSQDLVSTDPERIDALTLLARSLIFRSYTDYDRDRDRDTALTHTTQAYNRYPTNVDVQAIHAYALQAAGQPVAAAELAERALDEQPQNNLARVAMALSYGRVGSFEIALRESQRATQRPGWQIDSLRAQAISYSDLGNYEQAVNSVEQALRLHDRLLPLYFEQALYALQIGDADTATHAYYQIITLDPDNVKARLRLCELSSTMRERETALRYCTEVTEYAPAWSEGWYRLGREYFLQGNFAAAQEHLHHCATLQVMQDVPVEERRFECWYLQGQAAEIRGDCPALVATYNEFLTMTADSDVQQTWTYPPEGPPCRVSDSQNP